MRERISHPKHSVEHIEPKILWHHGTCDCCGKKLALICHFGYDTQHGKSYRICKDCIYHNLKYIVFGKEQFRGNDVEQ